MGDTQSKSGEKLISETIAPVFDGVAPEGQMIAGEPLVPSAFVWRDTTYPVVSILSSGKGLGPCSHGSDERYVRKHWYRIETADDIVMRIYFERRPRAGAKATRRWWLYTIEASV